ncbi:nucleoside-diphosphate-sugar epimerase [Pararhizobium capsulatum DSM 1112]|uniref:Nucleoside-diphosphate-sugar epimerase n=1 Tax=Pararhizobium capsulatum DSM 1112 TaxID=1121113 RepID=A0ABU0BXB9_9HYPH|nr:NAD-dependent epimerase/dehydratase family protein [Pararhizobium capsulatum]MDQ0322296.1 nucleoside-diphosphate-sugar epimerase [Pararhizobium capsulatum DSM 1112]
MFQPDAKIIGQDIAEVSNNFSADELATFAGKKILITGTSGLVGQYIASALHQLSDQYALDIQLYGSSRNTKAAKALLTRYIGDSAIELINFGEESQHRPYDYIFHTASSTNPVELATTPLDVIETNVGYTGNLLKLLSVKSGSFIFFSTREIYGKKVDPEKRYISEEDYGVLDPLDVRSAYPESKRLAENMIVSFNAQFGNPYRIFRISHTYGPGIKLNDGRVLSDIIGAMVNDENINLKSDGSHRISPTYIADVIAGVLVGILRGENGCYNVSNHQELYSILDIANIAASNVQNGTVIRPSSPINSSLYLKHDTGILSSEKVMKLRWAFGVPLRDGLRRVYQHYKINA